MSLSLLGLLAGALTTGAWLPQLLRTWRRGSAEDISWPYLGVFGAGGGRLADVRRARGRPRDHRRERRDVPARRRARAAQGAAAGGTLREPGRVEPDGVAPERVV